MIKKKILPAFLFIAIFITACSDGLPETFQASDFLLKDLFDDSDIRLSDLRGRPVILYFFASW